MMPLIIRAMLKYAANFIGRPHVGDSKANTIQCVYELLIQPWILKSFYIHLGSIDDVDFVDQVFSLVTQCFEKDKGQGDQASMTESTRDFILWQQDWVVDYSTDLLDIFIQ
jgi:hypothetical protein